jgi:hypothetical protein
MYEVDGLHLRGPRPRDLAKAKIAFVGAAQTFGRYHAEPFPALIANHLQVDVVNLGVGGKGPSYFTRSKSILDILNRMRVVVVQVLSARSVSNSAFESLDGGRDGIRRSDRRAMTAEKFYSELARTHGLDAVKALLAETRQRYVAEMMELLAAIAPPKILLWLSTRSPDLQGPRSLNAHGVVEVAKTALAHLRLGPNFELMAGCFPHLVDRAALNRLRLYAGDYVECVESCGLPEILHDRRTRRFVWNNYYPSEEMHRRAARALAPRCRAYLS